MTRQETAIVAGFDTHINVFLVTDKPDLHHLRIEVYELEEIKVVSVRVQVVQYLKVRWKTLIVSIGPRKVRELVITTSRLKLCRIVRTVPPDPSNGIRSLENYWVMVG